MANFEKGVTILMQSEFISKKSRIFKNNAIIKYKLVALFFATLFLTASVVLVTSVSLEGTPLPSSESADIKETERVTVSVFYGGKEYATCNSPVMTVNELLEKMNIKTGNNTVLNCSADDLIADEMKICVDIIEKETVTEIVDVPYETVYIDSQTIPKGQIIPVSTGANGQSRVTRILTKINGSVVSEQKTHETVIFDTVTEVCTRGIGGDVTAKDGTVYPYSYYIDVVATAYGVGGKTATGKEADESVIAVDPKVIPYGTKVFITGNYGEIGIRSAEDTGNFRGNHIDVCLEGTRDELLQFGRRNMRVYILE